MKWGCTTVPIEIAYDSNKHNHTLLHKYEGVNCPLRYLVRIGIIACCIRFGGCSVSNCYPDALRFLASVYFFFNPLLASSASSSNWAKCCHLYAHTSFVSLAFGSYLSRDHSPRLLFRATLSSPLLTRPPLGFRRVCRQNIFLGTWGSWDSWDFMRKAGADVLKKSEATGGELNRL